MKKIRKFVNSLIYEIMKKKETKSNSIVTKYLKNEVKEHRNKKTNKEYLVTNQNQHDTE